jgi:hypothetical protein
MTTLQIFDRPMCCSTGVCASNVDPLLPRFAADLEWLKSRGVVVERYNLAQQAAAFTQDAGVAAALRSEDVACLPLFRVNGEIVFKGKYPSRSMLARWCGVAMTTPQLAPQRSCCGPDCCS